MIHASDLTKRFGKVTAVHAMSFELDGPGVVGLLGSNGAGKTTTIRMITGAIPPSEGTVKVNGVDVRREPLAARRQVGYLPEATPLYPELRVREYLSFRARLAGLRRADRTTRIGAVLERCALTDVVRRPIRQLSKGYRQRVGLAGAILHEPPVIVLDEPTSGLDPAQVIEFRRMLAELGEHHCVLLSTHVLPEVEASCSRILFIASGRLRAAGTVEAIRSELAGAAPYRVETDDRDPRAALGTIAGVRTVRVGREAGGWTTVDIEPKPGAGDLREPIARALAGRSSGVRELTRTQPSLESLFATEPSS